MIVATDVLGWETEKGSVYEAVFCPSGHHDETFTVSWRHLAAVRGAGWSLGTVNPLPVVTHTCRKPGFVQVDDLVSMLPVLLQLPKRLNAPLDDFQGLFSHIHLTLGCFIPEPQLVHYS